MVDYTVTPRVLQSRNSKGKRVFSMVSKLKFFWEEDNRQETKKECQTSSMGYIQEEVYFL
jgi:hypothetical protein